jgi:hypothetical protein
MTRKALLIILLSLSVSLLSFPQTSVSSAGADNSQSANISRKIDEFGRLGECDLGGRLDSFLIDLQNDPNLTGYILFYRVKNATRSEMFSHRTLRMYEDHLKFRKFDPARVVIINGGFRESETTELWLVSTGQPGPEPSNTVEPPTIQRNKTYLYHSTYLQDGEFRLPEEEEEQVPNDESGEYAEPENTSGEVRFEIPEMSAEEKEELAFDWVRIDFAEEVKDKKDNRGVIIFYADDKFYDIEKIRAHVREGINLMAKKAGLPSKRFEAVFGGFRETTEVDMWVVPKKGQKPLPAPADRPAKTGSSKIIIND